MDKVYKDITLKNVTGTWVYIDKPNEKNKNQDDKPKYGIQVIIPKGSDQLKYLQKEIEEIMLESFGKKAVSKKGYLKSPLKDADVPVEFGGKEEQHYKNTYYMGASNLEQPVLMNRYNKPPTPKQMNEWLYNGATYNLCLTLHSYPAGEKNKAGVGVYVQAVQMKHEGGPKFTNRPAREATSFFEAEGEEEGSNSFENLDDSFEEENNNDDEFKDDLDW